MREGAIRMRIDNLLMISLKGFHKNFLKLILKGLEMNRNEWFLLKWKYYLNIHERWWTIIFTWNELNYQVDLFSSLFQSHSNCCTSRVRVRSRGGWLRRYLHSLRWQVSLYHRRSMTDHRIVISTIQSILNSNSIRLMFQIE